MKPGWATSDRELLEGVIGSHHRRRQAWTLAQGPHRPGRTLSRGCHADLIPFRRPIESASNRFLDGNESLSYGETEERRCALF